MLKAIFYSSKKSENLSVTEIEEILNWSVKKNAEKEITGLLIEYKSHFLQYLEGPENAVYELYNKIKVDTRHSNVVIVQDLEIEDRIFPNWNMLFKNIKASSFNNNNNENIYFDQNLITLFEKKDLWSHKSFWENVDIIEFLSKIK